MSTYIVTRKSDGVEITRYAAMQPVEQLDDLAVPFAQFDHTEHDEDEPVATFNPEDWRIYVGSFFDRFGSWKLPILASADSLVQAVVKDCTVRKYIDLKDRRTELLQAIGLLQSKGFAVDAAAALDAQPTAEEVFHG